MCEMSPSAKVYGSEEGRIYILEPVGCPRNQFSWEHVELQGDLWHQFDCLKLFLKVLYKKYDMVLPSFVPLVYPCHTVHGNTSSFQSIMWVISVLHCMKDCL